MFLVILQINCKLRNQLKQMNIYYYTSNRKKEINIKWTEMKRHITCNEIGIFRYIYMCI